MRRSLGLCVAMATLVGSACGNDWVLLDVDAVCGATQCVSGSDVDGIEVSLWEAGAGGLSPTELQASGRTMLGADAFRITSDMALPVEVLLEPDTSTPQTIHAAVIFRRSGISVGEVVAEIEWMRGQTNRALIEVPVEP